MIFAREHVMEVVEEVKPLLVKHYEEIAWRQEDIPLDVDWKRYQVMDDNNMIICFTGRVAGKLVAYSTFFLMAGLHYNSTRYALNDVVFIQQEYRGNGGALLQYAEEELKALGIDVITYHIKHSLNWGPLAERLGYEPMETNFMKWIGGPS